ncbi:MAG TPA: hypothetical protein VMF91_07810 [Bryobacteraceae bacterium]|nr:hypothetical protein [Bryobacteraceae bacterium]
MKTISVLESQPVKQALPEAAPEPGWHGEFPLGGSAIDLAIAQNADGRLELFYAGTGNHLYHKWQLTPNGLFWSDETAFAGDSANQIAVARNADGRLEIFYVGTNNTLYHNWQTAPNSTSWAGETAFPGAKANEVRVAQNADGRLEIFYRGTENHLYHNWQLTPNSTKWKGETAFSGDSALQIAVARNADGRLEMFYVGTNTTLYHNWQTAPGATTWKGETAFPGAKANEVEVGQNQDGRLEIFYRGIENHLYHNWQTAPNSTNWNGETAFPNNAAANQVVVGQNADGRLEIFYRGLESHLNHNWQTAANTNAWNGETAFPNNAAANQVVVGQNADGRLEIFYRGTGDHLYHDWQRIAGTNIGSNSNYILGSNCQNITGLTVTINITQDIVCQSTSASSQGFSLQLNAYSPKNEKSAWQQYVFTLDGSELSATIENWPVNGDNLFNDNYNLFSIPSKKLPSGYKLSIALQNDNKGNITGATYTVIDATGKTLANVTKSITSHGADNLAPIIGCEMNLVGPYNGEYSLLSSGAGTFTYKADQPLTPVATIPACAESLYITLETANTLYAPIPGAPSTTLTQNFNTSNQEMKIVSRPGTLAPGLHPPSASPTTRH